jgi:putative ABC transport system permease protein
MISTLVIGRQLQDIRDRDPGYDRSQVFMVWGGWLREHATEVRAELSREPAVKGLSMSNADVINNGNTTGDTEWDGKPPNSSFVIRQMRIDEQFIPLMKMKLVEGANFTGIATDSMHYILNETAVRRMGLKDPVGKRFKLHEVDGTIIGVVRDFNYAGPREQIEPAILSYRRSDYGLYVKTSGRDAAQAIAAVRKLSERYHAGFPFDYSFLDESFETLYRADQQTGTLFRLFAGIAIFISCLGLFALASYTAQVRTREIGIRKVLGASVASIIALLSRDFLRLIGIAILVACPLAWLYMHSWLQSFVYRIAIGWWVFLLAGGAAVVLALVTIGWQSVRAALSNPVDSLRSE